MAGGARSSHVKPYRLILPRPRAAMKKSQSAQAPPQADTSPRRRLAGAMAGGRVLHSPKKRSGADAIESGDAAKSSRTPPATASTLPRNLPPLSRAHESIACRDDEW